MVAPSGCFRVPPQRGRKAGRREGGWLEEALGVQGERGHVEEPREEDRRRGLWRPGSDGQVCSALFSCGHVCAHGGNGASDLTSLGGWAMLVCGV